MTGRSATIDPNIYGNFIEHLGRCIYGGIYEENSPLSDERGFRLDVLEAIKGLNVPVLRWPGGNFVSGYHWMDGIGPKEKRPRKVDWAWHAEESNRFGTDEFIEYCREVGTEPYICVNLGTGTIDEAAAWVEYCNGTGDTYYANLRRQNGHPEPYNVKYWGLGNEMYGFWQIGAKTADDYAKLAMEAAKLMKWTDPSIKLDLLRRQRHQRLGPRGAGEAGAVGRVSQHPPLHRRHRLLRQRVLAAPGRALHPRRQGRHRPGQVEEQADQADLHRLRRVEPDVPAGAVGPRARVHLLRRPTRWPWRPI